MMAAANFLRILALILRVEGGYVDNPHDPGGATKYGITLGTLSSCRGKPAARQT
jgi:lysozyme family protein